jgi:Acetyltransferase (GNAT) domain
MASSNNIETRYLQEEEYPLWDAFVDQSPEGTIYHKTIWLKAFAQWQNLELKVAACYKGKELTGGMAFTCKKKFGLIKVMQIPFKTPFYGPVLSDTETKYRSKIESKRHSTLNALTDFLMSDIGMFTAVFAPSVEDVRPFIWKGFETRVHYTYISKLDKETDLLVQYDPPVRRQIKKGEQYPHSFHKENAREDILRAQKLEQQSFERQNLDLKYAMGDSFVTFIQSLLEEDSVQVYTIKTEGRAAASLLVILDQAKKMAYYWLAGADPEFLSTGLNQLLLHLVLEDLKEQGFKGFDFVGAGTETIARYKATYNFPLVPVQTVNKARGIARLALIIKKYL